MQEKRHAQVSGTLSVREQQMLAIGRSIMSKPHLLLMNNEEVKNIYFQLG